MKRTLTTLLSGLLFILAAGAETYFASPEGGGDGFSIESPTTFVAGLKLLKNPGDTLYLLSGRYDLGNTPVQNLSGSTTKRIVISGYEGSNRSGKYPAVLDFRKTPYGTRGLQIKSSCMYLHIKNLALCYSGKNNLYNEGSYNLFENLDIYGSGDTGCQMKNGGNNIIKNVDSHDNFDYKTMSGNTANFGGNADGFADKQFTGAGNHYIGCRAWNNSDDGWDFFQRVSTSETIIEDCVCFANGAPYYDMKNHARYETDKDWFESKAGTQIVDRYGNTVTVTMEKYPCQGNGNGFKMGGQYTNHKILVHHCLAVGNYARGFDQNNNGGAMRLYNNSAYDNYTNYGFTTAYGTNTLQNNISLKSQKGDSYKSQNVVSNDHNSWNSGYACIASDFQSLDTTQILAPRRPDGSLPEGTFMRPADGSSLIDAGIDVNIWYNGKAPDIGCYEAAGERHEPEPEIIIPTEQPDGTYAVALVTLPGAAEDKPLLQYLRLNESLWVVETDAMDNTVDYSTYDVLVLSSKPNSGSAGFAALKGYDKPIVLLKPFLLKSGAWGWGAAANTQDQAVSIPQPEHPLFNGVEIHDGKTELFSECHTNAVTAISTWTATEGVITLGTPLSHPDYSCIAVLPEGTNCNGTILSKRVVMIGVSEYSTGYLTETGKQLIENAILYQLGINPATSIETSHPTKESKSLKYIDHGKLYIQAGSQVYDSTGRCLHR